MGSSLTDPNKFLFLLLVSFCIAIIPCSSQQDPISAGNETDHQSLLEIKARITGDQFHFMRLWNETVHYCNWTGVTCGARHRRVIGLQINGFKLKGTISPYIGNLTFLRVLMIPNNLFHNGIPQEIGRLRRLQVLDLSNNTLTGSIPSTLSSCSGLTVLTLRGNMLDGPIPESLGSFRVLQRMDFRNNNLSGTVPPSLGSLSSLQYLYVSQNNLSGTIPPALGNLKSLIFLSLGMNNFHGTLPPSLFNISTLRAFGVVLNQLEGTLPPDMGLTLPSLEHFAILNNRFSGTIPPSLSNATNLVKFQIAGNNFTGNFPSFQKMNQLTVFHIYNNSLSGDLNFICSLTNATGLLQLGIWMNNFEGEIPDCISDLTPNLTEFSMSNNRLSGRIPAGIGNLSGLERLQLDGNQLSVQIPPGIGQLQKLNELQLHDNNLTGTIPSFLGDLKAVRLMSLSGNNFQGSIPSSLSRCRSLVMLDLSRNNLTGPIPSQILDITSLSIGLDLSSNRFTGALPTEVGNLKLVGQLRVAENLLSGEIPSSLARCESLELLDLSGNQFQGALPGSFGSLRGLRSLNVSRNRLTGEIPTSLLQLATLQALDLSYNDLAGPVPSQGIFSNNTATSLEGNTKLCGGMSKYQLPRCHHVKRRKVRTFLIIVACVVSVALAAILLLSAVLFRRSRNKGKETKAKIFDHMFMEISYQTLLKITNGFSSANLIGIGSFGSVYKGDLSEGPEGNVTVAVKVFNLLRKGASKSFVAECEALRNIRHRNLLKILTVCSGTDYEGNDFKALVFDYMANGSLEEWLHKNNAELVDDSERILGTLTLLQRLNIAIDVARALDYLHNGLETPVVHCDLKPSNVLLDKDMNGCLGDFGLVRFLKDVSQTTAEMSSIGIRGSVGYAAPGI